MTKNPLYNALVAVIYIILIVFLMNFIGSTESNIGVQQFIMPIMLISLFTLSAAVMGYLFCYQPLMMYLDGKKEQAVKLFLQTTVIFGGISIGIFLIYYVIEFLI